MVDVIRGVASALGILSCLEKLEPMPSAFKMFRAKWLHLWGIKTTCTSIKLAQNESV